MPCRHAAFSDPATLSAVFLSVLMRYHQPGGEEDDPSTVVIGAAWGTGATTVVAPLLVEAGPADTLEQVEKKSRVALSECASRAVSCARAADLVGPEGPLFRAAVAVAAAEEARESSLPHVGCDLMVSPRNSAGLLVWRFADDVLDAPAVARIHGHMGVMFSSPRDPISLAPMLTPEEVANLTRDWQGQQVLHSPPMTALDMFEAHAAAHPDRRAAVYRDSSLTYGQLDMRANALASELLGSHGVKPGDFVAICIEASLELVLAVLAIHKAGAAYVPIEPAFPSRRLQFVIQDAGASVLLTQAILQPKFTSIFSGTTIALDGYSKEQRDPPMRETTMDSVCYMIYTSGSTGEPKGVLCHHAGLANLLHATDKALVWSRRKASTMWFSPSFDNSVLELFYAVSFGGELHLADADTRLDNEAFFSYIREHAIDATYLPPHSVPFFRDWLRRLGPEAASRLSLRSLLVGTEPLDQGILQEIWSLLPSLECFWNEYGPTEACVLNTFYPVPRKPTAGQTNRTPIGRPLENTTAYVVDRSGKQLCPVGVVGEVLLGGICIAHGYHRRQSQTEERFIPDFLGGNAAKKLYRTGDLARWLPDGNLLFVGRTDAQIKWHGYRIEPGEIAAVLTQHPLVRQAVVVPRMDSSNKGQQLVAYVAGPGLGERKTAEQAVREIRKHAVDRLAMFMCPSLYVPLEHLPLVAHGGKVDQKSLPAPEDWHRVREEYAPPQSEMEAKVAALWREFMGMQNIGVHDDFFGLGGHSLQAAEILAQLRNRHGADVPLYKLFQHPTIAEVAALATESIQAKATIEGIPRTTATAFPRRLSASEEGMLLEISLLGDSTPYNEGLIIILEGPVNADALGKALAELASRHENLRSTFKICDDGVSRAFECAPEVLATELLKKEDCPQEKAAARAHDIFSEEFSLGKGPLIRCRLLRLVDAEPPVFHLVVVLHHLVSDGFSFVLLYDQLGAFYNAAWAGAPFPPKRDLCTYRDSVEWEHGTQVSVFRKSVAYWKKKLQGARVWPMPSRKLPLLVRRSNTTLRFRIPAELVSDLQRLARRTQSTLYNVVSSAYHVLLTHFLGGEDSIVVSPWFNRPHTDVDDVLGCFVNLLALRSSVASDPTFEELVLRGKQSMSEALENPIPASWIVRLLGLGTTGLVPSTWLLFFQNYGSFRNASFAGCTRTKTKDLDDSYLMHVNLELLPKPKGSIQCKCDFDAGTVPVGAMKEFLASFQKILATVAPEGPSPKLSSISAMLGFPPEPFGSFSTWHRELKYWATRLKGCGGPVAPLLAPSSPRFADPPFNYARATAISAKGFVGSVAAVADLLCTTPSAVLCAAFCAAVRGTVFGIHSSGFCASKPLSEVHPLRVLIPPTATFVDAILLVKGELASCSAHGMVPAQDIEHYIASSDLIPENKLWRATFRGLGCCFSGESAAPSTGVNDLELLAFEAEQGSLAIVACVAKEVHGNADEIARRTATDFLHTLELLVKNPRVVISEAAPKLATCDPAPRPMPQNELEQALAAKQTELEAAITRMFCAVLLHPRPETGAPGAISPADVSADSNFFVLGGNSLDAIRIAAMLRSALGAPEIPLPILFRYHTPRTIAAALVSAMVSKH